MLPGHACAWQAAALHAHHKDSLTYLSACHLEISSGVVSSQARRAAPSILAAAATARAAGLQRPDRRPAGRLGQQPRPAAAGDHEPDAQRPVRAAAGHVAQELHQLPVHHLRPALPGCGPCPRSSRAAADPAGRAACMQRPCVFAIRRALRWKCTALEQPLSFTQRHVHFGARSTARCMRALASFLNAAGGDMHVGQAAPCAA